MRKLILFTLLIVLYIVGYTQSFGRLRIHSGLYDNYVINGPDTSIFGWRSDRYFIGTDNAKSLELLVNGIHSGYIDTVHINLFNSGLTHFGYRAGQNDTMHSNTFIGYYAGMNNTSGFANVAIGSKALMHNTTALYNTAVGDLALEMASTNGYNTAVGQAALQSNVTGMFNSMVGEDAYQKGTGGNNNSGIGAAILNNCYGESNTAIGSHAGNKLTSGGYNLFVGHYAGYWGNWNAKGFIDVYDRGDSASQLTSSPIIIDFNVDSSLQKVSFNAEIIQRGVTNNTNTIVLADDSTLIFPNALKGGGDVWVFNASDSLVEMGTYGLSDDGTIYLLINTGGITKVGTTDNKFNIFDNGTGHTYENKLGYPVTVMYEVKTW